MLKFYNTLTRKKEKFKPIRKKWVGLYTCGPTVYNYAHIGNLRTYIFEDALRRTLEYAGYKVRHVMNTTDVDDKTIRASKNSGKPLKELTRRYEKFFLEDLKKLNIELPSRLSRATEHIPEMIALIKTLLRKGFAYQREESVYFDISKFKPYGKLAKISRKDLKPGARVDADEYDKEHVEDFVLWKGKKEGEPSWKAPFGEGRPGWHIECSAMSMKYLGRTFDLHTAGIDLIFPHHENEIAQSEAATGRKFVRYWVHGEHLLVEGEKMAKSLRNFYTLRDIEAKEFNPLSYRYLVLTSHYRSKLNFTWESLRAAQRSLERLYDFVRGLAAKNKKTKIKNRTGALKFKKRFATALLNDLDTPKALATVWNLVHQYHKNPARFDSRELLAALYDFDQVLGLRMKAVKPEKVPPQIARLVKKREEYRRKKEWAKADDTRRKLNALDWTIEDTETGPRIKPKK